LTKLSLPLLSLAAFSFASPPERTLLNDCQREAGCSFNAPKDAGNKHVRIVVDGSISGVTVLLNNEPVGENHSGITPLEFDLTPALKAGAVNTVAVRLDKPGRLRSIYLLTTGRVYPVKQTVAASPQRVGVSVMVRNTLDNTSGVQASFEVSIAGKTVGVASTNGAVPPNLTQPLEAIITLRPEDVKLWDPDHPNLYRLRTVITKNAEAVEGSYETELESSFGIRTVEFRDARFLLNGEPLRLGGAHIVGEPGEDGLRSMKEAGMVFQMVDHPVSTDFVEWADRNGMLLIEREEMRARDGNHPSVIAWTGEAVADFAIATPATLDSRSDRPVFLDAIPGPDGLSELLNKHPAVFGAAAGNTQDPKWAGTFRGPVIQNIFQRSGNTFVEIHNRSPFPSQILRGYEARVGHQVLKLPTLRPGETVTLEFEHVNPYKVEVSQPTGFVVDSR